MLRETRTENGSVRGLPGNDARITVYKGIPFAKPPVGDLRWHAPEPCEDWEGVRDCVRFGPISVQDTPALGDDIYCREWHVDSEIPMGEDCLYLNVWTPAKRADEKLPVLLWYFGGGYQWGYTAEMEFNGEHLASLGIVVVSVNYRLGAFAFLAHPEITKENPDAPGNFGLLDQQAGLKWVYRNIANFGGDPEKITIAGQSAGGNSTMQQLVNPDNDKYIKGAVVLSGIIRNEMPDKDGLFTPLNLEKAEKKGEEFFSFIGASSLEEARKMDAIEIRDKYAVYAQNHTRFAPIEDGKFNTGDPVDKFIEGAASDKPFISGYTKDEFIINGTNVVERSVFTTFDAALKNKDRKLFSYLFCPEMPGWDHPGCFHSSDLWFFFGTLEKCWRPFRGYHYDLARQMSTYLANFVKYGDPNGADDDGSPLPEWKEYTMKDPSMMSFGSAGAELTVAPQRPAQAFNPYLPSWEYIPDGEPYVFDGRIYVYGSHDRFGGQVFCMNDYVCWSADVNNLADWRYEGVIYPKTADPLNKDGHMCLYAPDVAKGPDGRYYLYYVLDKVSVVSVAVCDTPAGRFEYLGNVHYPDGTLLGNKEGDEPQFDPGVLYEDGKVYLFTGFCGRGDQSRHGAMLTILDKDMLTILTPPRIVVPGSCYSEGTPYEGHAFFEAPSIRKRGDIYYFIYSSEVMHELCYAVSDRPDGEYTYGGVIVSNCDLGIDSYKDAGESAAYGANNHGSMEKIGNDWYIFYHRHTSNTWYARQGCAEKLSFTADGKICQAEITSCGLNGGPLSDRGEYPAYIACNLFDEKHAVYVGEKGAPHVTQDGGDGTQSTAYIADLHDNSTAGFKFFDLKGVTGLKIRTMGYFKGEFEVRTGYDTEVLGRIPVDFTNVWTAYSAKFPFPDGVSALYLTFKGNGSGYLKSFEFLH